MNDFRMKSAILVTCCCMILSVRCEVYTALVEMEELLDTEIALMDTLSSYISAQEERLDTLKR
jgi:hypothetical protein